MIFSAIYTVDFGALEIRCYSNWGKGAKNHFTVKNPPKAGCTAEVENFLQFCNCII